MSTPQQPWSSGQQGPPAYPHPPMNGWPRHAPGEVVPQGLAPQGHGQPDPYGRPQGYGPQAYGPPQGYGPQVPPQPYGNGPTGQLVVNLRKPFGSMGLISPVVTIDGYPAPAAWGRNTFPVPAGVRQVEVAQTYLWTYGRASMPVPVQPGGTSEIFYAGPMATIGFGGAIGTEPQKSPGTALFVGLLVVVLALLLLVFVAVLVGSS